MRLQTAEQRAEWRKLMTPKGSIKDQRSNDLAEVYTYEMAGALYAIGFRGTAGKPAFHYRFRDAERREKHIAEFFSSVTASAAFKATERAKRNAYQHDVKVGDIFRSSWGYDQTNIDYYQVVELIGSHYAMVREISQQSEETAWAQGNCVPAPGVWATEADYSDEGKAHHAKHGHYPRKAKDAFKVKIQGYGNGEPSIKVRSFAYAYREKPLATIAGANVYKASHWTAYH